MVGHAMAFVFCAGVFIDNICKMLHWGHCHGVHCFGLGLDMGSIIWERVSAHSPWCVFVMGGTSQRLHFAKGLLPW